MSYFGNILGKGKKQSETNELGDPILEKWSNNKDFEVNIEEPTRCLPETWIR